MMKIALAFVGMILIYSLLMQFMESEPLTRLPDQEIDLFPAWEEEAKQYQAWQTEGSTIIQPMFRMRDWDEPVQVYELYKEYCFVLEDNDKFISYQCGGKQ